MIAETVNTTTSKNRAKPLIDEYLPGTLYIELSRDAYKKVKEMKDEEWIRSHVPKLPTLHRFMKGKSVARLIEDECYNVDLLKKFTAKEL